MPVGNERRTAGTAYLFENLQGSVDTITDQKDKCPENAPSCATYLRILAERSADKALVEYIVYPGENNTSDFNVRRNSWYNLELVIRGENEIDNRVLVYDGLYYGTANCHICTGDQVTFDVTPYRTSRSRNYAYLGIEAGDEYAPASAGLLWQDNKIITGFTLADNRLTVHTNGQRGNALVAVYDAGGTILWSWHIWCLPNDRPQDDRYTNRAGEQFLVMDRNLGAIGTDLKTRYGLVYTWGRKDPFTSNEVYNAAGRKDRFINHWPTVYTSNGSEAKTYDLTYMTRHPTTYVYTGGGTPNFIPITTMPFGAIPRLWTLTVGRVRKACMTPVPKGTGCRAVIHGRLSRITFFPENLMWSERSTTAIGSSASGEIRRGRFIPYQSGTTIFGWIVTALPSC